MLIFNDMLIKTVCLLVFALNFSLLAEATNPSHYALPQSDAGIAGEGAFRNYPGYAKNWLQRREAWSKMIEQDQRAVVFLGDSITQGWGDKFKDKFPSMKLANRGIGGDTTRSILYRLQEDVLKLNPSAIVMLMGTNDLEIALEPEAIARNFELIYKAIKEHSKTMPVVLCKVFPSSETKKRPADKIKKINELYEAIVKNDPQFTVVDTWTLFANESGDATAKWFPDLLHLNAEGYDKWAKALTPIFATLGFTEVQKDEFEVEAGYLSLFNGQDLTGWGFRPTAPRKQPKSPNPNALLFVEINASEDFKGLKDSSDGRYEAMHGRLVVKTPCEGRRIQQIWTTQEFAGDFILKLEFRATPNADSGVFIRKPQLQCRDFPLAGPYHHLTQFREGDWNELVVTVTGGIAHATCNGELLTNDMAVPESGPIGLEGDRGQMEYRRIRLKQL